MERESKVGIFVEFALAATIILALYNAGVFFYSKGYLPPPFFDQPLDTFMDWYNTVYWGHRPGTYDEWYSIYPPFAFLFMNLFSTPSCYYDSAVIGRSCDPLGVWTITAFTVLNVVLLFLNYRKVDAATALPRTLALGLGLPALFAWERGNVIVPCFTFFILAHGRLLRSTWLRWICFGVTANLKPYLILAVLGRLARGKWRWAEGCGIASILIFTISFMVFGKGDPLTIITNMVTFAGLPDHLSIDHIEYSTTYNGLIDMTKSALPLMYFLGSKPMEMVEFYVPLLIRVGEVGVVTCYAIALWRPKYFTSHRLAALAILLFFTVSGSAGGYAELYLLFLIFFERWKSVAQVIVLLSAYILCIPWDHILVNIIHAGSDSYLSGRSVSFDFGVTLGAVVRPGLLLIMEYGLVAASFFDVFHAWRTERKRPAGVASGSGMLSAGPAAP